MNEAFKLVQNRTDAQELVDIFAPENCKNCEGLEAQAEVVGNEKVQWHLINDITDVLHSNSSSQKLRYLVRSIRDAKTSCPGKTPNGMCRLDVGK